MGKSLRASELGNLGNYESALAEYQQLLQSATSADERAMYLFELFNINAIRLVNRNEAQRHLTQMQAEFPTDGRTRIAAIRFAGMTIWSNGNGLQMPALTGNSEGIQLPVQFNLAQNYPNPFNPTTTMKYDLPDDGHVVLKVYDVLGREVLTLVDEEKKAGYHSTTFDASGFSSGVYFYRLHAGSFISVKKMMVLK